MAKNYGPVKLLSGVIKTYEKIVNNTLVNDLRYFFLYSCIV